MLKVKESEIKKIIGNEKVEVENMDLLLRNRGVLVKVHVGRIRADVRIPSEAFGVKNEEAKKFLSEYVDNGNISFLPKKLSDRLLNIENKIRDAVKKRAIGWDGQFLSIQDYKLAKEDINRNKEIYLAIRDNIYNTWDEIVENYKNRLKEFLVQTNCNDEQIYKSIILRIPNKEEYRNSFYVDVSLRAFPILENAKVFDIDLSKEIEESQKNEVLYCVKEITVNVLNIAFKNLNACLKGFYKNNRISGRTKTNLFKSSEEMKNKNVTNNNLIVEIASKIHEISLHKTLDEDIAENCEILMSKIFGFCKEINFLNGLDLKKCELSELELSDIYNINK